MASRKDYEAVAAVIRQAEPQSRAVDAAYKEGADFARLLIALNLAELFRQGNPRFDKSRFMNACGLDETNEERGPPHDAATATGMYDHDY